MIATKVKSIRYYTRNLLYPQASTETLPQSLSGMR